MLQVLLPPDVLTHLPQHLRDILEVAEFVVDLSGEADPELVVVTRRRNGELVRGEEAEKSGKEQEARERGWGKRGSAKDARIKRNVAVVVLDDSLEPVSG
jgi:hypothetical protein